MKWLLILFFFLISSPVFAARNLSISANKSSLFGDEELTLSVLTSGFSDGESIYIKGAFYQEGLTNYFGFTKNGDNWVKNGDTTTSQRSVQIGAWDGSLMIKSDFSDSGYKGEGDYKLKIGFYYTTSGGSLSSVNWSSNSATIALNEPDPTPTNTPTPRPTDTPVPTSIPTSAPTPTKTPTPTPKKTPTPTIMIITETATPAAFVLGTESGEILGANEETSSTSRPLLPYAISLLLISLGLGMLSLVFIWKKRNSLLPKAPPKPQE